MKKIGDRISFEDSKFKTTVVIIPERNHFVNMLMGAWLGMWYCIGAVVIWSLFHLVLLEQERIILYIFYFFGVIMLLGFQNHIYGFYLGKSYLN
uniref:Uncharacterized protein n=1 Tax=uncultured Flavobacteriia bacterium TaxID=212695 RepID=H6RIE6_9BACT|nr:conserved hypothetical protein, membrane [uncultured Flavobacteriia bacterium]